MALPTPEHVRKMIACAPLLPPPGDEVVKELAQAYLALYQEHEDLKKAHLQVSVMIEAINGDDPQARYDALKQMFGVKQTPTATDKA